MEDISKKCAVELSWNEVCNIVSEEIEEVLGLHIQCKANVVGDSFWNVTFINDRLPLPMLCQLVHTTHPTLEDWEEALPDDGGVDVGGFGMVLAEKLVGQHLSLTWEHHLVTVNGLWLIGMTTSFRPELPQSLSDSSELSFLSDLLRSVADMVDYLHGRAGK